MMDYAFGDTEAATWAAWDDKAVSDFKALGAKTSDGNTTNDDLWVKNATAAGLSNAQGVLDEYRQLYTKYAAQYTKDNETTDPVTTCINNFKK